MDVKKIATAAFIGAAAIGMLSACQTSKSADSATQASGEQNNCSGKTTCKQRAGCK